MTFFNLKLFKYLMTSEHCKKGEVKENKNGQTMAVKIVDGNY